MNKQQLINFARRKDVLIITSSVISAAVASELTFVWTNKKMEEKYAGIAEREIAEAKDYYAVIQKEAYASPIDFAKEQGYLDSEPDPAPETVVAPVTKAGKTPYGKISEVAAAEAVVTEEIVVEVQEELPEDRPENIFSQAVPVWDYNDEIAKRSEDLPYVVSKEEYMEADLGYSQNTMTYFDGDDVLADDKDQMVDEIDEMVGRANLDRFGAGSNDRNIVFVRNDRLEMDFEIVRSNGDYAKEVLGFDSGESSELKHSARPGRFRTRDE